MFHTNYYDVGLLSIIRLVYKIFKDSSIEIFYIFINTKTNVRTIQTLISQSELKKKKKTV